ncbi:hypothetical protein MUU74_14725 [Chryseobacterium daecheongense]|uniref:SIR2 family protein n=1 Tax=Chryseobacterium daecheongense TaxID=192389 RepID=UPI001FD65512|nr:SIR2 family protein [Chryseobacterium daecheongense]UOU97745.1 hypothetical protein MUU74_14725 [Chryseobacterium daecheongense]
MKTILLVGNGFNYMVENWINNLSNDLVKGMTGQNKDEITKNINEITKLWQKFNEIFEEIKLKNPRLNDEELIRIIYSVIDLFSAMSGLEKIMGKEKLEQLKGLFDSLLLEKIKDIALEFKNHHESVGYKNIKKLFSDFGNNFNQILIDNNVDYIHIFTTNYDGILDTLLTNNPYGFIFHDGFGNIQDEKFLGFYEYNINFNKIICHIHGSYLYQKSFGKTFKLRENIENSDPVMIFNNPDFKEDIIKKDSVLLQYYEILESDLKDADQLIIFGNSMINEPHIKNLIKQYGNREDLKILIFSTNPDDVAEELKEYYGFDIARTNTRDFDSTTKFLTEFQKIL